MLVPSGSLHQLMAEAAPYYVTTMVVVVGYLELFQCLAQMRNNLCLKVTTSGVFKQAVSLHHEVNLFLCDNEIIENGFDRN